MNCDEIKIRDAFLTWNTYRLPTTDNNLFDYFVDLLETPIGLRTEYNLFRRLIFEEYNGDADLFLNEVNRVKNEIETKYNNAFLTILNTFEKRNIPMPGIIYTNYFNLPNGEYLEIDLSDALTTSMFKYGYFNFKHWNDFIEQFSDKQIFKLKNTKILLSRLYKNLTSSAYLLHKKRMRGILAETNNLKNIFSLKDETVLYVTGDSVLIDTNYIKDNINNVIKTNNIVGNEIHLSIFKMEQLYFTNGYYVNSKKDLLSGKITYFSGERLQTYYLPMIYKLHMNMPLNDNDLYYGFNECILKLKEPFSLLIKKSTT